MSELIKQAECKRQEAERRVTIKSKPRRTYDYGGLRDKSFNEIYVDGEHRGYLVMDTGWRKPWRIYDLSDMHIASRHGGTKENCRHEILRQAVRGNLPIASEMDAARARAAEALAQRQARDDEAEALRAQQRTERRVLIGKHMLQLGRIWGRLNNPTPEETAAIDFAIEHLNRLSENKEK